MGDLSGALEWLSAVGFPLDLERGEERLLLITLSGEVEWGWSTVSGALSSYLSSSLIRLGSLCCFLVLSGDHEAVFCTCCFAPICTILPQKIFIRSLKMALAVYCRVWIEVFSDLLSPPLLPQPPLV